VYKIWWRSVKGFWHGKGSSFTILHRLEWSSLTHCHGTAWVWYDIGASTVVTATPGKWRNLTMNRLQDSLYVAVDYFRKNTCSIPNLVQIRTPGPRDPGMILGNGWNIFGDYSYTYLHCGPQKRSTSVFTITLANLGNIVGKQLQLTESFSIDDQWFWDSPGGSTLHCRAARGEATLVMVMLVVTV